MRCVNIACGASVVDSWINLDFTPAKPAVIKANLLSRLPLADQSVDVCYSSHFLEHVPTHQVAGFLNECYRILVPTGRIRLVMPDFEEMCREYLATRAAGEHGKADFVILEILDQCVRQEPGGRLGKYYRSLPSRSDAGEMRDYVRMRTGEDVTQYVARESRRTMLRRIMSALQSPGRFLAGLQWGYSHALALLFPPAFRNQNIAFTSVGERHMWIYDFHTVEKLLQQAGFVDIEKLACDRSHIPGFPLIPLDMDKNGNPRKGRESMFIEAVRPAS